MAFKFFKKSLFERVWILGPLSAERLSSYSPDPRFSPRKLDYQLPVKHSVSLYCTKQRPTVVQNCSLDGIILQGSKLVMELFYFGSEDGLSVTSQAHSWSIFHHCRIIGKKEFRMVNLIENAFASDRQK